MIPFNLQQPPFSFLEPAQLDWLSSRLIPIEFTANQPIIDAGCVAAGLYLIAYGVVEEREQSGQQVLSQYAQEDMFDVRSALANTPCKHHYVAIQNTQCLVLRTDDFQTLLHDNDDFSAYFRTDLGARQVLLDDREQKSVAEFVLARVGESEIRAPQYVSGQTSLARVAAIMEENQCKSVLVRTFKNVGIVTMGDLLKATLLEDKNKNTCVADIANYPLITINQGDFLFSALLKMTQNNIERVVVSHNDDIVGTLELVDMLNIFASHSSIVSMRIEHAKTVQELKISLERINALLSSLNHQGTNVFAMLELITILHRRIMQRAFELIFPTDLQGNVCILALGSEGRSEKLLHPCQANAVVLLNDCDRERAEQYLRAWHNALCDVGYPRENSSFWYQSSNWVNSIEGWSRRVNRWLKEPTSESMRDVSALLDAHVISGDADLFLRVKDAWLTRKNKTSVSAYLIAEPALKNDTPLTFLGNLRERNGTIDIKQGGLYPLVQGIRALAFEYNITATNTLARLDELQAMDVVSTEYAQSLKDTLTLLFRIRVRYQLECVNEAQEKGNVLQLAMLRRAERDMLRYALHRVKRFKQFIADHYFNK